MTQCDGPNHAYMLFLTVLVVKPLSADYPSSAYLFAVDPPPVCYLGSLGVSRVLYGRFCGTGSRSSGFGPGGSVGFGPLLWSDPEVRSVGFAIFHRRSVTLSCVNRFEKPFFV